MRPRNDGINRSEPLTVRLAPKTKFALEVMARAQHRNITGVVEWALGLAMAESGLDIDQLYSTSDPVRLRNLAAYLPALLTWEENRLIETMKASGISWREAEDNDLWDAIKFHADTYRDEPAIVPMVRTE